MWNDIRHALRFFTRNSGFTTVAVLTLALGIGLNTAIFSLVYALMVRPLPYGELARLVEVVMTDPENSARAVTAEDFLDWRRDGRSLESLAIYEDDQFTLTGRGAPIEVTGAGVSTNFFSVLQTAPLYGTTFNSSNGYSSNEPVVILAEKLWTRLYGRDPNAVGRSILLDGIPHQIVGIMPADVQYPRRGGIDLWTALRRNTAKDSIRERRFTVVGRLARGFSPQQAKADLDRFRREAGWGVRLRPLSDRLRPDDLRLILTIFTSGVTFVLMIACLNLSNLLLARGLSRTREISIRKALGESRARLLWRSFCESLVIGSVGGVLGIVVANWGVHLLKQIAPTGAAGIENVSINFTVLLYAAFISLLTALVVGLLPAAYNSRVDPVQGLKRTGNLAGDPSRRRTMSFLIGAEIAVATILVAGGLLAARSLQQLVLVEPGFDPANVLVARLPIPEYKYATRQSRTNLLSAAMHEVRSVPGVLSIAAAESVPLGGGRTVIRIEIPGVTDPNQNFFVDRLVVSGNYFATLRVPLVEGRDFESADVFESPSVVIINQAMQKRFWPDADPVGRQMDVESNGTLRTVTIIGVARDMLLQGLDQSVRPAVFLPFSQWVPSQMILIARTGVRPEGLIGALHTAIWSVDSDQPVPDVRTLRAAIDQSQLEGPRSGVAVLGTLSAAAMLLASIGIYGIARYTADQKTREVGVRMALGAKRLDIVRLMLRHEAVPVVAGAAVGLIGAVVLNRVMSSLLFGVTPADPLILIATGILLVTIATLAILGPARRAARIDPIAVLRQE